MTKQMTVKQYAEEYRKPAITVQAATSAIRNNHKLPGVVAVEKFGRYYLLTVETNDSRGK